MSKFRMNVADLYLPRLTSVGFYENADSVSYRIHLLTIEGPTEPEARSGRLYGWGYDEDYDGEYPQDMLDEFVTRLYILAGKETDNENINGVFVVDNLVVIKVFQDRIDIGFDIISLFEPVEYWKNERIESVDRFFVGGRVGEIWVDIPYFCPLTGERYQLAKTKNENFVPLCTLKNDYFGEFDEMLAAVRHKVHCTEYSFFAKVNYSASEYLNRREIVHPLYFVLKVDENKITLGYQR